METETAEKSTSSGVKERDLLQIIIPLNVRWALREAAASRSAKPSEFQMVAAAVLANAIFEHREFPVRLELPPELAEQEAEWRAWFRGELEPGRNQADLDEVQPIAVRMPHGSRARVRTAAAAGGFASSSDFLITAFTLLTIAQFERNAASDPDTNIVKPLRAKLTEWLAILEGDGGDES